MLRRQPVQIVLRFAAIGIMVLFWGCSSYPLHNAILADDAARYTSLLDEGASIHELGPGNHTPLHIAAMENNTAAAQELIKRGAKVDLRAGTVHYTPLFIAAYHGSKEMVDLLIGEGADVNARCGIGRTPLYVAAEHNSLDIMKRLMEAGCDLSLSDNRGLRPFDIAYRKGHFEVTALLLAEGVQPKPHQGVFLLGKAIERHNLNAVSLLLEQGADPNGQSEDLGIHPMVKAVTNGALHIIPLLKEHGAELPDYDKAETPLVLKGHLARYEAMEAALKGDFALALEKGEYAQVCFQDLDKTLMEQAAQVERDAKVNQAIGLVANAALIAGAGAAASFQAQHSYSGIGSVTVPQFNTSMTPAEAQAARLRMLAHEAEMQAREVSRHVKQYKNAQAYYFNHSPFIRFLHYYVDTCPFKRRIDVGPGIRLRRSYLFEDTYPQVENEEIVFVYTNPSGDILACGIQGVYFLQSKQPFFIPYGKIGQTPFRVLDAKKGKIGLGDAVYFTERGDAQGLVQVLVVARVLAHYCAAEE